MDLNKITDAELNIAMNKAHTEGNKFHEKTTGMSVADTLLEIETRQKEEKKLNEIPVYELNMNDGETKSFADSIKDELKKETDVSPAESKKRVRVNINRPN